MRVIALIPARGGSKGIPRKNLQELNGKPLIAHKIIQAQASICSEVWVSSEDIEIQYIAKKFGAEVINRPKELATDEASTNLVIIQAINFLQLGENDILVLLQPTSPLINVESINECVKKLIKYKELGSVITVRESHTFNWITKDNLNWEPFGHDRYNRKRRQDLSRSAWETGGCYALRIRLTSEAVSYHQSPTGVVNISHIESLDIDTLEDLKDASLVLRSNIDN
jgi:CMP-N,N'-diacetyllegionaminic acid synthase